MKKQIFSEQVRRMQKLAGILTESQVRQYGDGGDFDKTGLIVTGRTQLDNNKIQDMIEESEYYGVWNATGKYWFFQEDEETLDALEKELQMEFVQRGINAIFEAQF